MRHTNAALETVRRQGYRLLGSARPNGADFPRGDDLGHSAPPGPVELRLDLIRLIMACYTDKVHEQ
jgi:hypothetical protein